MLAVADEWSTEQIDEFKAIVEQVTKVSFSSKYRVFERKIQWGARYFAARLFCGSLWI